MSETDLSTVQVSQNTRGSLNGLRVLDLSRLVAGNMLTLQLADQGADVIKIETKGSGDTLREWRAPHPDFADGYDGWWRTYARNKRSLAINLRDAQAMEWFRRLLKSAQVFVESFRPGTLEKIGLSPSEMHAVNPKLIIVRLSGWGQDGPYHELPGFGSLIEGFSGFAHKHRNEAHAPVLPNLALADMVAGLTGAFAVMAALREVEVHQGPGQVLDLSLLEPMLAIMGPDVSNFVATGIQEVPGTKIASPRGSYCCKDGRWVSMSGSTDTMARRVFEAIGKAELFDTPEFNTNQARLSNDAQLDEMIATFIAQHERDECLALFRSKGVTVGPIYDAEQLLNDPHILARKAYVKVDSGDERGVTVMHNVTPRLQGTPGSIRRLAPRRGEHSREILQELGASRLDIDKLGADGAIEIS